MGAVKAQLLERTEERLTCPTCRGTGELWYREHRVIPTEDGTRTRVDKRETPHTCDHCDGRGYLTITPAWSGPGEEPLPF